MGNTEWERKYLLDAQISGNGLYAQRQAKERLEKIVNHEFTFHQ